MSVMTTSAMTAAPRPIRTLIVDDEPMARASLRALLGADPDIEVVGECCSGADAVTAIAAQSPELVFLDVQMPRMTGVDVLAAVGGGGGDRRFAVVFVTAYDEYALAAFDVQALDYVLKPFDQRFQSAVERAKDRVRHTRLDQLASDLAQVVSSAAPRRAVGTDPGTGPSDGEDRPDLPGARIDRIAIREGARTVLVALPDIDWIEASDYYVQLHVGDRTYLHREPLRDLEARLDPRRFVRIHRSAIVALDRVAELRPSSHGDHCVRLRDGTELRLSRTRRARLRALLGMQAPAAGA